MAVESILGRLPRALRLRGVRRENLRSGFPAELKERVEAIRWVHRIELGDGYRTPGEWNTDWVLNSLSLPDLEGKTVLDVGAWDGFYSFEAERRGAKRVLATDHFCWSGPGWGTRAGFDLAHEIRGSKVEALDVDVLELGPENAGVHDVVLFLGVLYHLRNPLLALEHIASVTGEVAIVETLIDATHTRRPTLTFYGGRSKPFRLYDHYRHDTSTWFAPNEAAVRTMLEDVGFRKVVRVGPTWPAWLLRYPLHLANQLLPFVVANLNQRAVFHAYK